MHLRKADSAYQNVDFCWHKLAGCVEKVVLYQMLLRSQARTRCLLAQQQQH
jgi:hypothetical protein